MTNALVVIGVAAATVVALSAWNRIRFVRQAGAFRCRLSRPTWARSGGAEPAPDSGRGRWHWRTARAVWVHDVLLVQPGLLPFSVVPLMASPVPGARLRPIASADVAGLGGRPVWLALRLEDGHHVRIAVAAADRESLVGPFLAAAIPGLPHGPRQHDR